MELFHNYKNVIFVTINYDCTVSIRFNKPDIELGNYIEEHYHELFPQKRIVEFVIKKGRNMGLWVDSFYADDADELVDQLFHRDICTTIIPARYTAV